MADFTAQILTIPTLLTTVPVDTGGTATALIFPIIPILSNVPVNTQGGQEATILSIVPLLSPVQVHSEGTISARFLTDLSTARYINRVYDSIAGKFVIWQSSSPDTTGSFYPGPGTFGVNTTDYVVITREV